MKSIITFACTLFIAFCYAQEKGEVLLSGTILNPVAKKVNITDANNNLVVNIALDDKNSFSEKVEITSGSYNFGHGSESTKIYLVAGDKLNITLDTKEFDETVKYTGTHAAENNFLAKAFLRNEQMGKVNNYNYYASLDETEFLALTDSVFAIKELAIKHAGKLDSEFLYIQQKELEYEKANRLATFQGMHRFVTKNQEYTVSDNYPNAFANIDFEDEKQLSIPSYFYFIDGYFKKEVAKTNVEIDDFYTDYLLLIEKEIANEKIKADMLFFAASTKMGFIKNLKDFYETFSKLEKNEAHKAAISAQYNKLMRVAKGQPSPGFAFKNSDGDVVKLTDLKGKLVYIDVWATWCQPCLRQIPSLKELEEEMHGKDITFVSICTFDKEERWRKMLADKELGGVQLFAEDGKDDFFTSYFIDGIPRFILLDAEGNIIDANAARPSNPDLKTQLEELLAK